MGSDMKKIIITTFAVLYSSLIWAINGMAISQSTIGDGLESQSLNTIAKDRQGRLWVGSDVGLSLISNGTVTNIRDIPSEGGLIILGNINSIVCTETVLMACDDRILHYDHENGFAKTLRYDDRILHSDGFLLEGDIATFYDKDSRSLYSYDMKNSECTMVAVLKGNEDYSFCKILRSESDSTILYLADNTFGLYRYNRRDGSFGHISGTDFPITAQATSIDNSNVIWISVPSQGIKGYYINSNYEMVAAYNTLNCDLPSNDISLITPLTDGNLLTCHYDAGLSLIERRNIKNGKVQVSVIPNIMNVTSTLVNRQEWEILYATAGFGLISTKKTFIDQIRFIHEQKEGIISYENYTSAIEEPEGTVILATNNNGLCRMDPVTGRKESFRETSWLSITSMCRYDRKHILMSNDGNGLVLFSPSDGSISSLKNHPALGFLSNIKSRNTLLVSSPDGDIYIFNADSHHYVFRKSKNEIEELNIISQDGLPVSSIENVCVSDYAVYVTYRGAILEIGFDSTYSRCIFHNKDKVIHNITSMSANSQGELFFTEPEGLHRYDPRSNFDELLVNTWGNGRFMNVAIDINDRIWFTTTNEYLHLYDFSKKELLMYSLEDGVPDSRFLNTFSICTTSGIILFPNANGLVTINTNGPLMYDTPPVQVTCTSARTDKKTITWNELANSITHPVRLPVKFRELYLEFSANSFNPIYPHLLTYDIYRDNTLVMSLSTTKTSITIPKMENGTYSVDIRQAYRKGLSDPQTIMCFKIPRPFFGTIPGVLVSLILILLFGYSIARISSNIEKNRMEKAMAAQDIKNREDKIAFLSNIAHELRTPLSLIYNPVKDFLQEKSVDGIDYERMERIFNQVNKMTVMVNMILDSSRADVNKADILMEEVNLNEWLNFLLEDYRIDCYGKGFSLKFLMDNSIGTVSVDKRIIETGLSNMVNNAIKYSTSGTSITVSTSRMGDMIRVSVKDQGKGFSCDPEDLFKRYYRENADSSIPGYGLGLPYARLQLSLIGGNMSACHNDDGVGSTFYMEFPAVAGEKRSPVNTAAAKEKTDKAHSLQAGSPKEGMAQDFDTNNMSILYVSSDEAQTESFINTFKDMFRIILNAKKDKEAVKMLKRMDVDLVISDVDMPDIDGFELCKTIKSTLEISHIPVILLTSRSDERNRSLGYKAGADAFIAKPYDSDRMYSIIISQLGGRFEIKRQYRFGFFKKMNPDQTFSFTDEDFIRSLNDLIEVNLSDSGLNEESIIVKLGLTRDMMQKKMEGLMGTNLSDYLNGIRIETVRFKLSNTDDGLDTIARDTGFSSIEAMSKAFKHETGKNVFSVRKE